MSKVVRFTNFFTKNKKYILSAIILSFSIWFIFLDLESKIKLVVIFLMSYFIISKFIEYLNKKDFSDMEEDEDKDEDYDNYYWDTTMERMKQGRAGVEPYASMYY